MSFPLVITKPDDTALDDIAFTIERGVPSDPVSVKIKNIGILAVVGASVRMYAELPASSGIFVTSGHRVLDELMGRFLVTGQDSTATPGQEIITGETQTMGHLKEARLPNILPGDWILADIWLSQPTSSSSGGAVNVKFEISPDATSLALPEGVSQVGSGVLTGIRDARSFAISGLEILPTTVPDDTITRYRGSWLLAGKEHTDPTDQPLVFDQLDGNGDALASGESYVAAITQGEAMAPTVTKGVKDTAPQKPEPPAGEIILAWVTVAFAGSTVIASGDIEMTFIYGRLRVRTGTNLGLTDTFVVSGRTIHDFGSTVGGSLFVPLVDPGSWVLDGTPDNSATTDAPAITDSNLVNDGLGNPLTVGHSYIIAISQGLSGPVGVKGTQADNPTRPAFTADTVPLGFITIFMPTTGDFVQRNIEDVRQIGPVIVTVGSGLNVFVSAGEAIAQGFIQFRGVTSELVTTASETNSIWLDIDGSLVVNTTGAAPSPGAHLLAVAITNSTDVLYVVDRRSFVPGGSTLVPHAATHGPGGTDPLDIETLGGAPLVHTHVESDVTGLVADLAAKAPLASPALTGTPSCPTPGGGTNIANKDYVDDSITAQFGAYLDLISGLAFFLTPPSSTWDIGSNVRTVFTSPSSSLGATNVRLGLASTNKGHIVTVIKDDSSGNAVSVNPHPGGSDSIFGGTVTLAAQGDTVTLICDGLFAWWPVPTGATP